MIKKYNIFLTLCLVISIVSPLLYSFKGFKDSPVKKVRTIVIDPGHGGKDPGCNGVSHNEKEVALAVALKLGKLIEENIKDVKVIYTRKTDVFVELEDRAQIANENNADLFISIHCNAAGKPVMIKDKKTGKMRPKTFKNSRGKLIVVETANPVPFGSETYVMGLKNEEGKMKVAQRENSAILLEDNYEKKYQGFDPNSEESYIIMSNYTSGYVIQSASLALKIQEEYSKKAGRVDKGVHRQSIWVLWRTAMPSVLTEIGYLTNPQEEQFLGSEKGQEHMAACLFRAFRKYKDEQEGVKKEYDDSIENQKPLAKETYTIETATKDNSENDEKLVEKQEQQKAKDKIEKENLRKKAFTDSVNTANVTKNKLLIEQKNKEDAIKKAKLDSLQNEAKNAIQKNNEQDKKYKQFIALADVNFKNKKYDEALVFYKKANTLKGDTGSYASRKIKDTEDTIQEKNSKISVSNITLKDSVKVLHSINNTHQTILFKVQFASSDKEIDVKNKFVNVNDVWIYKVGAIFKYTSGSFTTMEEATKHQLKLLELGYKDCFVAAFKNNIRMDINEAKKITGYK